MARLSEATERVLAGKLPVGANVHNPVDVLGDARADRYRFAAGTLAADENVHAILAILTPQTSTEIDATADAIADVSAQTDKPVLGCFMGRLTAASGAQRLKERGVPNYDHPERAVVTLDAMWRYHRWTSQPPEAPPRVELDEDAVQGVLRWAREAGMEALGERHARRIAEACGLRLPSSVLAGTEEEAVRAARQMGYPVVLKVSSDDILHKSDVGGVRLNLESEDEVRAAFRQILAAVRAHRPEAGVDGVLVQQMVSGGIQVIVGFSRDPQFGPLVVFGLGGIYVEALRDVTFRVAPLTRREAVEMTEEIKTSRILKGLRGSKPADIDALADCILRVSQLAVDFPELAECDINPLLVFERGKGVVAVDVRFALAPR